MTMYGYSDLFQGTTQADEYYCRAAFKGKRDPEFFIYTLRRMPRHNRNYYEKVEYLQQAGLYDKLKREEPEYLQQLLEEEPKMKRGISNEQICILTLVDENNKLYLEPVSVGRLEKAMAKAKHEVVPASKHTNGKYNLAKVNSVHSALSKFMDSKAGKVYTTKYLDLNLMLFWWLFKYREYSTEEKAQALFKIMNDEIPDIDLREKVNQVTVNELQNREITLDAKYR